MELFTKPQESHYISSSIVKSITFVYIAPMLKRRSLIVSLLVPLLLLFVLGVGKGVKEHASFFFQQTEATSKSFSSNTASQSILYTFFTLSLPGAIVSLAASSQAGFVEGLCFFLLALFLRYPSFKIPSLVIPVFIYAYFRKLFTSLILINAP